MKTSKCKIRGCGKTCNTYKGGAHGLCCMHYRRLLRHGNPKKFKFEKTPQYTDGCLIASGYALVNNKGQFVKRCRVLLGRLLNRELTHLEIVHHINENRLDDRLENLQIVSRAEHIKIHKLPGANKKI